MKGNQKRIKDSSSWPKEFYLCPLGWNEIFFWPNNRVIGARKNLCVDDTRLGPTDAIRFGGLETGFPHF